MKVLLVNPYDVGRLGLQNVFRAEPLGLECIAASLAENHDVRIQDLRWQPDLEAELHRFQPDVVGISCLYTSHVRATWDIARRTKAVAPGTLVVAGGQPPTLAPHLFRSPDIDVIVRGDGERVMPAACAAVEKGDALASVPDLVLNDADGMASTLRNRSDVPLSDLPRPSRTVRGIDRSRHFLVFAKPIALVEINRGCPFDCSFCSIWKMGQGRLRSLPVDEAVAEIASVRENDIFFTDDHFFANPTLMRELGEALVSANLGKRFKVQSRADVFAKHPELVPLWAKAGLKQVFLGLEGHSDLRLAEVKKRTTASTNETAIALLREHGVGLAGNLMVDPSFTREEFQALRDYVERHDLHFASFCIATPFPGTDLWESRRDEITTTDLDLHDIQHAVLRTRLPLEDFYEEYARCWQLRADMQPTASMLHVLQRVGGALLTGKASISLLRNVRRFDRDVARASTYLEDHAASTAPPWDGAAVRKVAEA